LLVVRAVGEVRKDSGVAVNKPRDKLVVPLREAIKLRSRFDSAGVRISQLAKQELLELSPGDGSKVEPSSVLEVGDVLDPGVLRRPCETAHCVRNVVAAGTRIAHKLEVETTIVEENAEARGVAAVIGRVLERRRSPKTQGGEVLMSGASSAAR
jgi:hypothetical protein